MCVCVSHRVQGNKAKGKNSGINTLQEFRRYSPTDGLRFTQSSLREELKYACARTNARTIIANRRLNSIAKSETGKDYV